MSYEGTLPNELGVCLNEQQHCFWVAGHNIDDNTVVSTRFGGRAHKDGSLYTINLYEATAGFMTSIQTIEMIQNAADSGDGKAFLKNFALYDPLDGYDISTSGPDRTITIDLSPTTFPFDNDDITKVKSIVKLQDTSGEFQPVTTQVEIFPINEANRTVLLSDLQEGGRYHFALLPLDNEEKLLHHYAHYSVTDTAIVPCSCDNSSADITGKPVITSLEQKLGQISLSFVDMSLCEEAYAFERHLTSGGLKTAYAPNFLFYAEDECGEQIAPGKEFSDDLASSLLTVGEEYSYCVSAVAPHYMANTKNKNLAFQHASSPACISHFVQWVSLFY